MTKRKGEEESNKQNKGEEIGQNIKCEEKIEEKVSETENKKVKAAKLRKRNTGEKESTVAKGREMVNRRGKT